MKEDVAVEDDELAPDRAARGEEREQAVGLRVARVEHDRRVRRQRLRDARRLVAGDHDEALDAGGAQRVERVIDEGPTAEIDKTLGAAFLESAALAGSEDESVHADV